MNHKHKSVCLSGSCMRPIVVDNVSDLCSIQCVLRTWTDPPYSVISTLIFNKNNKKQNTRSKYKKLPSL